MSTRNVPRKRLPSMEDLATPDGRALLKVGREVPPRFSEPTLKPDNWPGNGNQSKERTP